jgi:hypothetical protein
VADGFIGGGNHQTLKGSQMANWNVLFPTLEPQTDIILQYWIKKIKQVILMLQIITTLNIKV